MHKGKILIQMLIHPLALRGLAKINQSAMLKWKSNTFMNSIVLNFVSLRQASSLTSTILLDTFDHLPRQGKAS